MKSRMLTRALALLFLSVFIFGVWSCRHSREIRLATGVHDKVSEDSWVIEIDFDGKLVQVQTIGAKTDIVFKAQDEFLNFLRGRRNWIVPVTFYCNGKPDKNCDLKKPYTLYVAKRKVEPVIVRKYQKSNP